LGPKKRENRPNRFAVSPGSNLHFSQVPCHAPACLIFPMPTLDSKTCLRLSVCFALAMLLAASAGAASTVRPPFERTLLATSGVPSARLDDYQQKLDRLAETFVAGQVGGDTHSRVQALHAFLHQHVLDGKFEASASDIGAALDGGAYNCAATSALFLLLAARLGLDAHAVSAPGHVWCRVVDGGRSIEVQTTCRTWFSLVKRSAGLPTEKVSPIMATHRGRLPVARDLSERQFLAIFHFNRGVTHLRSHEFAAAARENQRALELDPDCRPAQENLSAAQKASRADLP
jgi:hypothetical protein